MLQGWPNEHVMFGQPYDYLYLESRQTYQPSPKSLNPVTLINPCFKRYFKINQVTKLDMFP